MDHSRHTLPSSYALPLDNLSELSSAREPLTASAGNSQHHNLASFFYHDSKRHLPRRERHDWLNPTVPSQPVRQSVGNTLELRRQSTRRQRHLRLSRYPIVDAVQYQARRTRQTRESTSEDTRWPQDLEDAFLRRNPIVESVHYQAYRARQTRDGPKEDTKWPQELEDAFLDGTSFELYEVHCTDKPYSTYERTRHGTKEVFLWRQALRA